MQTSTSLKGIFFRKTYASIKKIRPGYVEHILNVLTNDYIHEYAGMHADYVKSQTLPAQTPASFDSYLQSHFKEAETHFWRIADAYAAKRSDTMIGKAYKVGRPMVASSLPKILKIISQEIDHHTFYEV